MIFVVAFEISFVGTKVRNRPILLKKSAMVSTAEKYAFEIEIFTLSRGFRAQISRSCAQKRHFQQSVRGQSERTDFFNTIGRSLPVMVTKRAGQVRCKWLVKSVQLPSV